MFYAGQEGLEGRHETRGASWNDLELRSSLRGPPGSPISVRGFSLLAGLWPTRIGSSRCPF